MYLVDFRKKDQEKTPIIEEYEAGIKLLEHVLERLEEEININPFRACYTITFQLNEIDSKDSNIIPFLKCKLVKMIGTFNLVGGTKQHPQYHLTVNF